MKIIGVLTTGPVVRNHFSSKMAGKSIATQRTGHHSLSMVLSTSSHTSSSPTFPTSSSKETVTTTEHQATDRSESTSVEVRGNLSHDLPDWLQEFKHGLVDGSVSEHRDASSSFQESPLESRAKVEWASGKNSVYTHFPKDPNCDICWKTEIIRASCRRRAGTTVVPKAEHCGDFNSCGSQSSQ